MFITVLPKPDESYVCAAKMEDITPYGKYWIPNWVTESSQYFPTEINNKRLRLNCTGMVLGIRLAQDSFQTADFANY